MFSLKRSQYPSSGKIAPVVFFPGLVTFLSLFFTTVTLDAQITNINTNSSQTGAANQVAPTTNVVLYYFTTNVTTGNASFTAINNFTTSGTYLAADISNLKLWISNFEFFGGGTLLNIATLTTGLGPGSHTFTFSNPIPTGVVQRYFWITADITSTAVCGGTIKVDLITSAMLAINGTKNYGTNNAAGLQTILGGTCVPAPIELLSFRGKTHGKKNILEWETATETNNDFFTLERSSDAVNFDAVARIEGAGNSTALRTYHYADPASADKILYYRLKQTDFDNRFSYSEIVSLARPPDADFMPIVYFDNTNQQLKISGGTGEIMQAEVLDLLGRIVYRREFNGEQAGELSFLSPGLYVARIYDGNNELLGQCKFQK